MVLSRFLGARPHWTRTWNVQLWFRDVNPSLTSNTTNGVTVRFR